MVTATLPHEIQLNITDGLVEGDYVCPNTIVNFLCRTQRSTVIAWSSAAYIGPASAHGTAQLQFNITSKVPYTKQDEHNPNTMATLVNKSIDQFILESTLKIRATSDSTVTCHHISEGTNMTINIVVLTTGEHYAFYACVDNFFDIGGLMSSYASEHIKL